MWGHPGKILGSSGLPRGLCGGVLREDTGTSLGSSGQHGLCMWEISREDLGMSLACFRLPGGLCMCEHQGRILGYPWDPPDCLEYHACGDIQGGFWDLLGLLQTAWRAMCVGLLRKNLGMSLGSSGLPEGL